MPYGMAFGIACTRETDYHTAMKPLHPDHQQEKRDRVVALIVFGLFIGTLIYVLFEHYFFN